MNDEITTIPIAEDIEVASEAEIEDSMTDESPPAVVSLGDAVMDTAALIATVKKTHRLKEETAMTIFQIHLQLMNMERDRAAQAQPSGQDLIDQIAREQEAKEEAREPDEYIDE